MRRAMHALQISISPSPTDDIRSAVQFAPTVDYFAILTSRGLDRQTFHETVRTPERAALWSSRPALTY